ncbi:hypothetical protein K402DRAFT_452027 [Aulographum hederae CBS 113979]|uniref:Uncharacterized protein n=1 Tax=Aulographum hederae CBS 113979 TaxID=1176131 RepID=A0A6G1H8C0_9PEZI|nr:hypothetical protein K402DRAFT_452027 [Aulographum hederae CBS 113979]
MQGKCRDSSPLDNLDSARDDMDLFQLSPPLHYWQIPRRRRGTNYKMPASFIESLTLQSSGWKLQPALPPRPGDGHEDDNTIKKVNHHSFQEAYRKDHLQLFPITILHPRLRTVTIDNRNGPTNYARESPTPHPQIVASIAQCPPKRAKPSSSLHPVVPVNTKPSKPSTFQMEKAVSHHNHDLHSPRRHS